MMETRKFLIDQLNEAKDDENLKNLIFRYYQGLDVGDSHWRESMHLDEGEEGLSVEKMYNRMKKSKRYLEEERLAKEHPGVDVNLLMLQRKYGRERDF